MYTTFGQRIKFSVVESLGIRDFGDMLFRIARIRLESGETSLASFEESDYRALIDNERLIEARVCHQVFEGNGFQIHSAFEPDPNSVLMLKPHPRCMHGTHPAAQLFWAQFHDEDKDANVDPSAGKGRPSIFRSALSLLGLVPGRQS